MKDQDQALERGVYRLAGAMLVQAIQDAGSNSAGRRNNALRWINGAEDSLFSFQFVCRVLNRDPEDVRRFCSRRAASRARLDVPFSEILRRDASWAAAAN
jgi:hypothetical protein